MSIQHTPGVCKRKVYKVLKKVIAAIVIVGLIVFSNSLFNDFIFDDLGLIVTNLGVHNILSIPGFFLNHTGALEANSFYRPIPYVFFTLLYAFFKENTFFYHLAQVVFHMANTLLLFVILKKYLKQEIAFFLSTIFLVHPINQETVVYIANLQDVLFVFFGLSSILLLQKNLLRLRDIVLANLLLFFSLLSKESGLLFCAFAFLYIFLFKKAKILLQLLISSIGIGLYVLLRFSAHISVSKVALIPIMDLSFVDRLTNIPAIVFYYLRTFFFPRDLMAINSWIIQNTDLNNFFLPLLLDSIFFAVLILVCGILYKKIGKPVIFFLVWFLLGLFIHLQIVPIDATVANRFFYVPIIGLLAIIGFLIQEVKLNKILIPFGLMMLVMFSARTMIRNADWKNQSVLLANDEKMSHDDYQQELLYGNDLIGSNKNSEAFPHIQKALVLYPKSWFAWNSLGILYHKKGDLEQARQAYLKSTGLNPGYYGTYENLGRLLLETRSPEALDFIRRSTELFPNDEQLWSQRILIEYQTGNYDEATLAAQKYYLLKKDDQSYAIYMQLFRRLPINIQW